MSTQHREERLTFLSSWGQKEWGKVAHEFSTAKSFSYRSILTQRASYKATALRKKLLLNCSSLLTSIHSQNKISLATHVYHRVVLSE